MAAAEFSKAALKTTNLKKTSNVPAQQIDRGQYYDEPSP
jgi:hypothetical protein